MELAAEDRGGDRPPAPDDGQTYAQLNSGAALPVPEHPLTLIAEASSALLRSPHAPDVVRKVVEMAQRFGSAHGHAVWRFHGEDGLWKLASSAGLSDQFVSDGLAHDVTFRPPTAPLVFGDIAHEPSLAHRRATLMREGICSMLVIPLWIHGAPTGTLVFYWKVPHPIYEAEIRVASALGNLAATALGAAELYDRELSLRDQAQAAGRRATFLADAGAVLASSLDYETTLRSVAKLAIPTFADWCAVELDIDGTLERVTVEHSNPAKILLAHDYRRQYPSREDDATQVAFRTGQALLVEHITDEMLVQSIGDPQQLRMIRAMGIASLMIAPMVNRGRTLGLLTFVSSDPAHRYTQADLALAREIARRAATAIDNSRLYADVRTNEERYRSLVSATTSIVWTTDPDGEFIQPQSSWEAFTGQIWDQHRGSGWTNALHPDDVPHVTALWAHSLEHEIPYEAEGRLWHAPTRQYRHFVARAAPVRLAGGSIGEWIGTVTDIHERKQAEEERNALLVREQQARHIAQLLNRVGPTLSAQLDPRQLSESIMELATKLIGAEFGVLFRHVRGEDGTPSTLQTLSGVPNEAFAKFALPHSMRAQGVVRSANVIKDPRFSQDAPSRGICSYLAVPLVSRSGQMLGGLFFGHSHQGVFEQQAEELAAGIASQAAIALDNARLFAESQRTQDALRRSNEDLRRANEDLNQFAYSASHDLQEPLRMVSAYTQLLKRRYQHKLDRQADDYIRYAVQGAERMENLVRDILAYTQAANFDQEEMDPVDANAVMEKVLSNLQQAMKDRAAVVTYDKLPRVLIHEIHLLQLFQNLVGNAIKYVAENTPPRVLIQAVRDQDAWFFSVRDNGIGIDPQYKKQVFGLFQRLHSNSEYTGTGLGLAICKKIVERYGGRIWVESALGKGATFYFTIPDPEAAANIPALTK